MRGAVSGNINGVRIATQPLYANVTPMVDSNHMNLRMDSLPDKFSLFI
jgi:hypothetical protein